MHHFLDLFQSVLQAAVDHAAIHFNPHAANQRGIHLAPQRHLPPELLFQSRLQFFPLFVVERHGRCHPGLGLSPVFPGQRLLPILYWLVLAVIIYIIMRHTAFGRHVYAVGSNERTTRLSGINTNAVKMKVYMLMGFIVSIASIVQLARLGNMDVASAGSGYELDAIAAVVVGGTAMSGGKGSVVGTVIGVLIIGIMNNLLILFGVDSFLTNAFKGAIVIFAVLMQRKEREA